MRTLTRTGRCCATRVCFVIAITASVVLEVCCASNQFTVAVGQSVTLPCPTVRSSNSSVDWTYKSSPTGRDREVCLNGEIVNDFRCRFSVNADSSLAIDDVQIGDAGLYTCVGDAGMGPRHRIALNVSGIHSDYTVKLSKVVYAGCDIRLSCHPYHGVSWRRKAISAVNATLDDLDSKSVKTSYINQNEVLISRVSTGDSGVYECMENVDDYEQMRRRIQLFVIGNSGIPISRLTVLEGHALTLTCSPRPHTTIEWRRKHLPQSPVETVLKMHQPGQSITFNTQDGISTLHVHSADTADSGLYSCLEVSDMENSQAIGYSLITVATDESCMKICPRDTVAMVGDTVVLSATTVSGYYPRWSKVRDDGGRSDIVVSMKLVDDRYDFIATRPGQTDLVIKDVTLYDAGTYSFTDVTCPEEILSSVVVLQTRPSCVVQSTALRRTTYACSVSYEGPANMSFECTYDTGQLLDIAEQLTTDGYSWTLGLRGVAVCTMSTEATQCGKQVSPFTWEFDKLESTKCIGTIALIGCLVVVAIACVMCIAGFIGYIKRRRLSRKGHLPERGGMTCFPSAEHGERACTPAVCEPRPKEEQSAVYQSLSSANGQADVNESATDRQEAQVDDPLMKQAGPG